VIADKGTHSPAPVGVIPRPETDLDRSLVNNPGLVRNGFVAGNLAVEEPDYAIGVQRDVRLMVTRMIVALHVQLVRSLMMSMLVAESRFRSLIRQDDRRLLTSARATATRCLCPPTVHSACDTCVPQARQTAGLDGALFALVDGVPL